MWKRIWKEWYYDFSSQNNILNHENQKLKGYNQELEGDLKHIIDMENEENYQYIHIILLCDENRYFRHTLSRFFLAKSQSERTAILPAIATLLKFTYIVKSSNHTHSPEETEQLTKTFGSTRRFFF